MANEQKKLNWKTIYKIDYISWSINQLKEEIRNSKYDDELKLNKGKVSDYLEQAECALEMILQEY